jgi:hypothetical protein
MARRCSVTSSPCARQCATKAASSLAASPRLRCCVRRAFLTSSPFVQVSRQRLSYARRDFRPMLVTGVVNHQQSRLGRIHELSPGSRHRKSHVLYRRNPTTIVPARVEACPSQGGPAASRPGASTASNRSRRMSIEPLSVDSLDGSGPGTAGSRPRWPRPQNLVSVRRPAREEVREPAVTAAGPTRFARMVSNHARSKRSRFITLVQAATKSWTNFFCASALP